MKEFERVRETKLEKEKTVKETGETTEVKRFLQNLFLCREKTLKIKKERGYGYIIYLMKPFQN